METLLSKNSPNEEAVIGIVAPLIREQRVMDALWVFETLNHRPLNFHAYIIGDGKERENLLRTRDGWNLFDRVHFLGHRENTLPLLKQFHVLLHLGGETASIHSVRDAVRLNIPVIATDTPAIRQIAAAPLNILIPDCGSDFRLRRRLFAKRTLRFFVQRSV